jgi:hypothetical protein
MAVPPPEPPVVRVSGDGKTRSWRKTAKELGQKVLTNEVMKDFEDEKKELGQKVLTKEVMKDFKDEKWALKDDKNLVEVRNNSLEQDLSVKAAFYKHRIASQDRNEPRSPGNFNRQAAASDSDREQSAYSAPGKNSTAACLYHFDPCGRRVQPVDKIAQLKLMGKFKKVLEEDVGVTDALSIQKGIVDLLVC